MSNLRVVQLSPTFFSESSNVGGGERYPAELAKALQPSTAVRLVSFSRQSERTFLSGVPLHLYRSTWLRGSILNPFSLGFLGELLDADILHIHQLNTMVSDLSCLGSKFLGKKVFLTDHGGGAELILNKRFPWLQDQAQMILQSEFVRRFVPIRLRAKAVVIKGGVDTAHFSPDPAVVRDGSILFVGRILPHKGINYLIEAFRGLKRSDLCLKIVGRVYNQKYHAELKSAAVGLDVKFIHDASDLDLLRFYRQAEVVVLPSVERDSNGDFNAAPELMGFALTEAQACGALVICTDAGAMPEFVREGQTGLVVRQNSGQEIKSAIQELLALGDAVQGQMRQKSRYWAESFSWTKVAGAHLQLYRDAFGS